MLIIMLNIMKEEIILCLHQILENILKIYFIQFIKVLNKHNKMINIFRLYYKT